MIIITIDVKMDQELINNFVKMFDGLEYDSEINKMKYEGRQSILKFVGTNDEFYNLLMSNYHFLKPFCEKILNNCDMNIFTGVLIMIRVYGCEIYPNIVNYMNRYAEPSYGAPPRTLHLEPNYIILNKYINEFFDDYVHNSSSNKRYLHTKSSNSIHKNE